MKRRFLAALAATGIVMTGLLAGCGGEKTFTINGNPIENYKIIYAENPETEFLSQYPAFNYVEDIQFDRVTANELQEEIKTLFGVTLEVCLDYKTEEGECEILIGATNRMISEENFFGMDPYDEITGVEGGKLYLRGGSFGATYSAKNRLVSLLKEESKGGKRGVSLTEEFFVRERAPLTTVACVGDSITEGASVYTEGVVLDFPENKRYYSWPVVLQRILWKSCYVYNFGCSGASVRFDNENPFIETTQWGQLNTVAPHVDITLFLLGTNDSFWDKFWSDDDTQSFETSFLAMMDALQEKNSSMRFTIMNCPYQINNPYSASDDVLFAQTLTYEDAKRGGYDVQFYDMRAFTETWDHACFCDGIHLSARGSAEMAFAVADMMGEQYALK